MLPRTFREREITFPETASGDRRMQPWAKVKTTGISEGEVFPIPVQQTRWAYSRVRSRAPVHHKPGISRRVKGPLFPEDGYSLISWPWLPGSLAAKTSSFGCQEVKKRRNTCRSKYHIPIQVHISLVSLKSPSLPTQFFLNYNSYQSISFSSPSFCLTNSPCIM